MHFSNIQSPISPSSGNPRTKRAEKATFQGGNVMTRIERRLHFSSHKSLTSWGASRERRERRRGWSVCAARYCGNSRSAIQPSPHPLHAGPAASIRHLSHSPSRSQVVTNLSASHLCILSHNLPNTHPRATGHDYRATSGKRMTREVFILKTGVSQHLPTVGSVHLVSNGLRTGWQQLSAGSWEHGMGLIKHLGSFAFLD